MGPAGLPRRVRRARTVVRVGRKRLSMPADSARAGAARPVATWPPGIPVGRVLRPPSECSPRRRSVPVTRPVAFLGLPAPRSTAVAGPLQGLAPWTECLAVLDGTLGTLLGFAPLGHAPRVALASGLVPGASSCALLAPMPVGFGARRPGVLRCERSGRRVRQPALLGFATRPRWRALVAREASLAWELAKEFTSFRLRGYHPLCRTFQDPSTMTRIFDSLSDQQF
jgi:hypothetical protein